LQRRKFKSIIDKFESKIERLEERIEEQNSLQPDLKLYIADEKNNLNDEIEIHPVFIKKTRKEYLSEVLKEGGIRELEKELKELRKKIESGKHVVLSISNGLKGKLLEVDKLESYEKKLTEYFEKLKKYRVSYREYQSLYANVVSLNFVLFNEGNFLAEGVKFYIYFSPRLKLSNELNFFKPPEFYEKKPKDPRLSSISDLFTSKLSMPGISLPSIPQITPKTYGGPYISKRSRSIQVMYWTDKLLHRHTHNFDPVYLLPPDKEIDIDIKYSIYAENVAGTSEGTLRLKIIPKK